MIHFSAFNTHFVLFLLFLTPVFSMGQNSSITNIHVSQRTDGSGLVDVYFNLSGTGSAYNMAMQTGIDGGGAGSTYNISIQASFDGGSTYTPIPPDFLSGDMASISPGSNKHIVWDGLGSFPNTFSTQARLELTATEVTGGGTPCPGMPTVTDIDGNVYNTVLIGNQCWMKENLKTTKYRNGINIEYPGINVADWQSNTNGAYAWHSNDISWKHIYGALYNWYAVANLNGLCPTGWRIPSDIEWTQMENYLMNTYGWTNYYSIYETNGIGKHIKSCRQVNSPLGGECNTSVHPRWNAHNNHFGTDSFGFSALPHSHRLDNGGFWPIGVNSAWWTLSEFSTSRAWYRNTNSDISYLFRNHYPKTTGFGIRCIKN